MTDSIFEITTANDGLDLNILPTLAEKAGVNRGQFLKCFNAKETAAEVEADAKSGAAAGASGTPFTLVISPKGNVFPINGAFPYEQAKQIIEKAINDK
jgi:predicted DsbA family dithiol-disulfide isomerase